MIDVQLRLRFVSADHSSFLSCNLYVCYSTAPCRLGRLNQHICRSTTQSARLVSDRTPLVPYVSIRHQLMLRILPTRAHLLRNYQHQVLRYFSFSTTMSSSRGVIALSDIPSWYDIYHKEQVLPTEDSEYAFNEGLNKRVALIVGKF